MIDLIFHIRKCQHHDIKAVVEYDCSSDCYKKPKRGTFKSNINKPRRLLSFNFSTKFDHIRQGLYIFNEQLLEQGNIDGCLCQQRARGEI